MSVPLSVVSVLNLTPLSFKHCLIWSVFLLLSIYFYSGMSFLFNSSRQILQSSFNKLLSLTVSNCSISDSGIGLNLFSLSCMLCESECILSPVSKRGLTIRPNGDALKWNCRDSESTSFITSYLWIFRLFIEFKICTMGKTPSPVARMTPSSLMSINS